MKRAFISVIKGYQFFSAFFPPHCRFYPSCSNYMVQSIDKHGILKGGFFGTIRICKCHPFHDGGYDPVK
ncbi:MAG: membrane protein insertion efficiency factor YidD [Cyanobacteriota bacterium]